MKKYNTINIYTNMIVNNITNDLYVSVAITDTSSMPYILNKKEYYGKICIDNNKIIFEFINDEKDIFGCRYFPKNKICIISKKYYKELYDKYYPDNEVKDPKYLTSDIKDKIYKILEDI